MKKIQILQVQLVVRGEFAASLIEINNHRTVCSSLIAFNFHVIHIVYLIIIVDVMWKTHID